MQIASQTNAPEQQEENQTTQFQHLISIKPLGFLYGSAGRFLSPENLVGRSGTSFPPHAATVAGLIAAASQSNKADIQTLQVAGPFWSWQKDLEQQDKQNFYVPTPFNCLVEEKQIAYMLSWHGDQWKAFDGQKWQQPPDGKFDSNTWISIKHWLEPFKNSVEAAPWEPNPHLHPRLSQSERCVDIESERGSLFLENAIELNPEACLVYLSNQKISDSQEEKNWYRFGGEGHLVEVESLPLDGKIQEFLNQPLNQDFALITPGLWGSNRFSQRWPTPWDDNSIKILTQRPIPYRYRLQKALSRGRYAVPAGTVYHTAESHSSWQNWPTEWFPREGISLKHFGCGLALPLKIGTPNPTEAT
jgi:CRISPR-associated protein Cmr3